MKTAKILLLVMLVWTGAVEAQSSRQVKSQSIVANWPQARQVITELIYEFQRTDLNEDQKIKLFPRTNRVLSEIQGLPVSPDEKQDMIKLAVALIAASIEYDGPSSTMDTLYFHYKANKQAYLREINALSSAEMRFEIADTFKSFENVASGSKR